MSLSSKLVLASALALGAAPAVATAAPVDQVVQVEAVKAPASTQDASDYAKREAQDKQVANYQGGSTVVIGISGGALLVILFLLLIL